MLALASALNIPTMAQEPFRIGLIAHPGEEAQIEGLANIKAAFSSALGLPVEVFVARDYAVLAQAQIDGRIDYAAYSATAYAAAQLRCHCLTPLAAPLDATGAKGLYSVLIIRREGAGAKGRLAVGPEDSLATRLVPLAASLEAQAARADGRLVEAASAAEAQAMFLQGKVDGFFGWITAPPLTLIEQGDDLAPSPAGVSQQLSAVGLESSSWQIVWQSALLPYGPHVVRSDLPAAKVAKIVELLTGEQNANGDFGDHLTRGQGYGFTAVSGSDYKPVEDALSLLEAR